MLLPRRLPVLGILALGCLMSILVSFSLPLWQELTMRSWAAAQESKRRTMQRSDVATAISRTGRWVWCGVMVFDLAVA